jgi:mono/diheme cytochrome c family protein
MGAIFLGGRTMQNLTTTLLIAALAAVMAGCYSEPMSQRGFSLPEGDPVQGREAFLYMQCHQCHTLANESLPALPVGDPYVNLGGEVTRVKTYGELVTSIINPSHDLADGYAERLVSEDGESKMYNYNGYMTVQELIDIVSFLQPYYEVTVPDTVYRTFP